MGRLVSKFLYFKYAVWADFCLIFYTLNMPYGQTYAHIFILQICRMCRLMPQFLYFKYAKIDRHLVNVIERALNFYMSYWRTNT